MNRSVLFALVLGFGGAAVLVALGFWQLDRLAWKEGILAERAARAAAAPVALPAKADPVADAYLSVRAEGDFTGEVLRVLVSRKQIGPGVRVIGVLDTGDGRRVMVDRGFLPEDRKDDLPPPGPAAVTGNLHWPAEVDSFTPPPDPATGLWFARDLPAMAAALDSEPLLIVAREPTGGGIEPMPVDASDIPNDHLGYAIQWFSLAVVWLGMTAYLLWRIRRRTA